MSIITTSASFHLLALSAIPKDKRMNKLLAIAVTLLIPFIGACIGAVSPEEAIRTVGLCLFPILLIFRPAFIRSYFGQGDAPIVIGWFTFGVIFVRAFLFPIWFDIQ